MRVVLDIAFDGRNVNDVFRLPCVNSVAKDTDGKVAAFLSRDNTQGRTIARTGDHICQFANGEWQVFGPESYQRLIKKGKGDRV